MLVVKVYPMILLPLADIMAVEIQARIQMVNLVHLAVVQQI